MRTLAVAIVLTLFPAAAFPLGEQPLSEPPERHLSGTRQLTFGGQNAEAYFSADSSKIIFQSTRPPHECDQIYMMNVDGTDVRLLSTGKGRTTCSFLFPDGSRFLYASTHLGGDECPPAPDRSRGYVWALYPSYDIFLADTRGQALTRLTSTAGYDAEAAVSPDGRKIVFTSVRDGDLDLYLMNADGSGVTRLTDREGFDGGPFFSWDGRHIVYRSHYPDTAQELEDYRGLLRDDLMRPRKAEIFVMNADGSGRQQVTTDGNANWSPFMHPDGRRIIYSSNRHDEQGRTFSLYLINRDGTGLERVTYGARFDSFPMFSRDGKKLVWCSSRNAKEPGEFNIFIADWVD
ncbi:MAG: PD40 domain-containing protein [bacterium]|nr:MAG: PD40 domain-containing protein [bacterium]